MTSKRKEIVEAVPRREMSPFDEMDRMFDMLFDRGWLRPFHELWPKWARWEETGEMRLPRVDVVDQEEEILVRAELPGVEKKDLKVDLAGQLLTIHGERGWEEKREEGEYFRAEIGHGTFGRTIRLAEEVEFDKAKAELKEGILAIHLPKMQKTERRRIAVE